jgi:hypothetical protein
MCISWVFRQADCLATTSKIALLESAGPLDQKSLSKLCIPDIVIGEHALWLELCLSDGSQIRLKEPESERLRIAVT